MLSLPNLRSVFRRRSTVSRRRKCPSAVENLEHRTLLAVVVSEFMASNETALFDADQNASDWIELTNTGSQPIDLKDWYLTDTANYPRWRFPISTVIHSSESMVVFASGRDRVMPNGELHTNFRLSSRGEYIGLIHPDGVTVESQTVPRFPRQSTNISYGEGSRSASTLLVGVDASANWLVPRDGSLAKSWTVDSFDDSPWTTADGPLGMSVAGVVVDVPGFTARMVDVEGGTDGELTSAVEAINVLAGNFADGEYLIRTDIESVVPFVDFGGYGGEFREMTAPYLERTNDTSIENFTMSVTADVTIPEGEWTIGFASSDGGRVQLEGVTFLETYGESDSAVDGDDEIIFNKTRRHTWTRGTFTVGPDGLSTRLSALFFENTGSDSFELAINPVHTSARPRISNKRGWELLQDGTLGWSVQTTAEQPLSVYHTSIVSDLQSDMFEQSTTAYLRYPFMVEDVDVFDQLILNMRYSDAFVAYLNGTEIARSHVAGEPQWNTVADTNRLDKLALVPERFDVSHQLNQLQPGENILAIHGLTGDAQATDFFVAPELVAVATLDAGPSFLEEPTPGTPNKDGRVAVSQAVIYSRAEGPFRDTFQLELATDEEGARIHYTIDGTVPTESSLLYTQSLEISRTVPIRARAFAPGKVPSLVSSQTFVRMADDLEDFSSNLPVMVLENFDQGVPTRLWQNAFAAVFVPDEDGRTRLTSEPDITSRIGMHARGSSTFVHEKTNYRIEFRNEFDEDEAIDLLGLPDESDFILFGPWVFDRTMVRNPLMFELGRQAGLYSPRTRFVEVFSDVRGDDLSMDDYMGVYVLVEKIKRDGDRVDIENLEPSDLGPIEITGGYILRNDRGDESDIWKSARGLPSEVWYVHDDPDGTRLAPEQRAYIQGYIDDFEAALYGPDFQDPEIGYQAFIDVDSFIDSHLLRALSNDPDGLRLSQFWTKDRSGKLSGGPMWDFDRTMGNDGDSRSNDPRRWNAQSVNYLRYDWWGRLFQDPSFAQRWVDRYHELRTSDVFTTQNFARIVDEFAAEVAEAQPRNVARWPGTAPNGGTFAQPGLDGWEAEVSHLKGWLDERTSWMDTQFVRVPEIRVTEIDPQTFRFDISARGDDVYYTLDGSDPRHADGTPSAKSIRYQNPFTAAAGTTVIARSFRADLTLPMVETPIPWSGTVRASAGPLDVESPTVVAFRRGADNDALHDLESVSLTFSEDVASSIDASDLTLFNQTTGAMLDLSGAVFAYDPSTQTASWDLRSVPRDLGIYSVTIDADDVHDFAGNPLGDDFTTEFVLTVIGDSNFDFVFDSEDLVRMLQAGQYEDEIFGNSSWESGDWNGDGDVTSEDIVAAFTAGNYVT